MNRLFLLCFSVIILASCGRTELNELVIVSGLGVDVSDQGMMMHFQVINPGGTGASQSGTPSGGTGGPVYTYSIEGESVSDIMQKAKNLISRKLYFSHVSSIVVGEKFAREEGIMRISDYLERYYQFRNNVPFFIAKDTTAEKIFSVFTPTQKLPAVSLKDRVEHTNSSMGYRDGILFKDILNAIISKRRDPVIFGVATAASEESSSTEELSSMKANRKIFSISGLALFKKDKLVDWLSLEESRSFGMMKGLVKGPTAYTLSCPHSKNGSIVVSANHIKGNFEYVKHSSPPVFKTDVKIKASVQEVTCHFVLNESKSIQHIQHLAEKAVTKELKEVFQKAKEANTDVLGLQDLIYKSDPDAEKKWKPDWEEVYQTAELKPNVTVTIENIGSRVQSIYEKEE